MAMEDKEYLYNQVMTANGPQLVELLVAGLIQNLEDAAEAIETGQAWEIQVDKAKDILTELLATLEGNSTLTGDLRSLYLFINRLISEGIRKNHPESFRQAIQVAQPLYEAWGELGTQLQAQKPEQGPAIVTGMTYGKTTLNEHVLDQGERWKKG